MLRGVVIGSVKQYVLLSFASLFTSHSTILTPRFEDMNRLINANNLKPVIDKVFPFEKTLEAYQYLESQAHVGKVVVKIA